MDYAKQIAWSDLYATGITEVDAQHRALLYILNKLSRVALKEPDGKNALWPIFEELNEYAAYHFLSEEKLMQTHLPADTLTAKHIAQHREYWVKISDFKHRYKDGDTQVTGDLVSFLNTWWIGHIQGTDKQMGIELNRHGVN